MKHSRRVIGIGAILLLLAGAGVAAYLIFGTDESKRIYSHIPGGEMRHSNARIGFSFAIPDGLTAQQGRYGSEEVRYVRMRDAENAIRFMLILTPIESEESTYTIAEARGDAPRTVMHGAAAVKPLPGIEGVAFESTNPLWPDTTSTEVWFRHGGYRYQMATPDDAALLDFVLSSWRFDAMELPLTAPVGP